MFLPAVAINRDRVVRGADFQVCCVASFQTRRPFDFTHAADLESGDTAGLETCATGEFAE